jgi:hypothetical protein
MAALLVGVGLGACGNGRPTDDGSGPGSNDASAVTCANSTDQGCPCSGSQTVACGQVSSNNNGYVSCSEGNRTCTGGTWGQCVPAYNTFKSVGSLGAGLRLQGLGQPATDAGLCTTNPCDPMCEGFIDNSFGIDGGAGLTATPEGGWTLPLTGGVACTGLQCEVPICGSGQTTTVTGTVYDPAAINPVFNALVMIPNGPVVAVPAGVSSDPCGGATLPPAVTYTYSATNGKFTLTGVPVGASIPLVIQIGRWRRVVTIDTSALTCGATQKISSGCKGKTSGYAATSGCLTRLPRTQSEGNIPHIAIGTGGLDAMECMLYRMGVSSTEYTDENGPGRIHVFNDGGAVLGGAAANHDISYLLGFACPGGKCPATATSTTTNITNPGFDTGNFNGWTATGSWNQVINNWWWTTPNSSAMLGSGEWVGPCVYSGTNTATQNGLTAPAGATSLSVDEAEFCYGSGSYVEVALTDTTSGGTVSCQDCQFDVAVGCTLPVTPGHKYNLTLTNYDQTGSGYCTETFFDSARWDTTPPVANLLDNYDLVMLPCDGGGEYGSSNWGGSYDDPGRQNLVNYTDIGGRLFTSHWGREWIERTSAALPSGPFPGVATWIGDQANGYSVGVINTGPAYGMNFDAWMLAVGATAGTTFTINPDREDTSAVVGAAARLFVTYQATGWPADFTFDTPVGASMQSGRVMFTDMHLAVGNPFGTFPSNCPAQGGALAEQEDAAEYLLFDLGACATGTPVIPPVFHAATFTRDFDGTCPSGSHPVWRYFSWEDTTPSNSDIVFTAATADSEAQLGTQYPAVNVATASGPDSCPGGPSCATSPVEVNIDPLFVAAGLPKQGQPPTASHPWLRVTMTLNPSSDMLSAPTLIEWQQAYDCVASE